MREDNYKFQIGHLVDSANFQLGRIMDRKQSMYYRNDYYYSISDTWYPEWQLRSSFIKGDKVLITNGLFKNQTGIFEKYSNNDSKDVFVYIGNTLVLFHIDNITRPHMETQKPTQQVIPSSIEVIKKTECEYISIPRADFDLLMTYYINNTIKNMMNERLNEMFKRWQNS